MKEIIKKYANDYVNSSWLSMGMPYIILISGTIIFSILINALPVCESSGIIAGFISLVFLGLMAASMVGQFIVIIQNFMKQKVLLGIISSAILFITCLVAFGSLCLFAGAGVAYSEQYATEHKSK